MKKPIIYTDLDQKKQHSKMRLSALKAMEQTLDIMDFNAELSKSNQDTEENDNSIFIELNFVNND